MIDAASPKAAGELFAQVNGPCPISPSKAERRDGEGGVAQPHRQLATGSISKTRRKRKS